MTMTIEHHSTSNLTRLSGSMCLAALATFSIFVLMDKLIENDAIAPPKVSETVIISPIYKEPEEIVNIPDRIKPIPPVIEIPPNLPDLIVETPDDTSLSTLLALDKPAFDKPDIDMGTVVSDSTARAIVQVQPNYPIEAARDGIEGWVKLQFNIDQTGQVTDINVLDSQPKRIFDKEAKRALRRWKYKPQIENGQPIMQIGEAIVLEFKLDNA